MTRQPDNNNLLHAEAQRVRLLRINSQQEQDILSLVAALQELHALISEHSNGLDEAERLVLAKAHIIRTLARHGTFPAKTGSYGRAR